MSTSVRSFITRLPSLGLPVRLEVDALEASGEARDEFLDHVPSLHDNPDRNVVVDGVFGEVRPASPPRVPGVAHVLQDSVTSSSAERVMPR